MTANPYQSYLNVQFETADQGTLILMTYDGAIRFCRAGINCIEQDDRAGKGNWFGKAFEAVGELRRSLRIDAGGDLAKSLDQTYAFVTRQITLANLTGKSEYAENAATVLEQLRDAWRQIIKQQRQATPISNLQA